MPGAGGSGRVHLHSVDTYAFLKLAVQELSDSGADVPCRRPDVDPEWWFTEEESATRRAKMLCRICPALSLCRTHALRQIEYGVWGGLDMRDRLKIRRAALFNRDTGQETEVLLWASS